MKSRIICERGALQFHLALSPAHYVHTLFSGVLATVRRDRTFDATSRMRDLGLTPTERFAVILSPAGLVFPLRSARPSAFVLSPCVQGSVYGRGSQPTCLHRLAPGACDTQIPNKQVL